MRSFGDTMPTACSANATKVAELGGKIGTDPSQAPAFAQAQADLAKCLDANAPSKLKYFIAAGVLLALVGGFVMFRRKPALAARRRRK